MPIVIDSDGTRAAGHATALPGGATVVTDVPQAQAWLAERPEEYAVIVGPEVPLRDAGGLAEWMRHTHPSAGVVLLREDLSTEVYSAAMAAGIPAVVADQDQPGLTAAVDRVRTTWEAIHGPAGGSNGPGSVITVFSPKGGVGKTTLVVNLALALAEHTPGRVCIVDLDLAFGDVAITLQLIPEHTVDEAADAGQLDYALLHRLLTPYGERLSVLAAPTVPDGKDRIPPSLVTSALTTLRRHFDYVVVDTSPGFDEHVLSALDETDQLVLVATLDVPTVKNMKMAIETLDMLGLTKDGRHLVLNRADDQVGLDAADVEKILKLPVTTAVPTDIAVATSTNHGTPIIATSPDHRVSNAFRSLAGEVSGAEWEAPRSGRRGIFGRRRAAAGVGR